MEIILLIACDTFEEIRSRRICARMNTPSTKARWSKPFPDIIASSRASEIKERRYDTADQNPSAKRQQPEAPCLSRGIRHEHLNAKCRYRGEERSAVSNRRSLGERYGVVYQTLAKEFVLSVARIKA